MKTNWHHIYLLILFGLSYKSVYSINYSNTEQDSLSYFLRYIGEDEQTIFNIIHFYDGLTPSEIINSYIEELSVLRYDSQTSEFHWEFSIDSIFAQRTIQYIIEQILANPMCYSSLEEHLFAAIVLRPNLEYRRKIIVHNLEYLVRNYHLYEALKIVSFHYYDILAKCTNQIYNNCIAEKSTYIYCKMIEYIYNSNNSSIDCWVIGKCLEDEQNLYSEYNDFIYYCSTIEETKYYSMYRDLDIFKQKNKAFYITDNDIHTIENILNHGIIDGDKRCILLKSLCLYTGTFLPKNKKEGETLLLSIFPGFYTTDLYQYISAINDSFGIINPKQNN